MRTVKNSFWFIGMLVSVSAVGQRTGVLSGSLESHNIRYLEDSIPGAILPDDRFGSNNYLKLDYRYGKISAGVQYEGYFPAITGYSNQLKGGAVTRRFLNYSGDQISFSAGHFYEQFGSGLIFRTWEERALGIDNAMDGINIRFNPFPFISVKGAWGKQRKHMDTGEGLVRGGDISFSLNQLMQKQSFQLDIGGSLVNKYEDYTGPEEDFPKSVDAFAVRGKVDIGGFSFYSEYVNKGEDPTVATSFENLKGEALLLNTGFSKKGFGLNISARRLENMDFRSEREATGEELMINYLPALTRQHKYALAMLHPYGTMTAGEIGGQADLYFTLKKSSRLGGRYGTRIHCNYSQYHNLKEEGDWPAAGDQKYFSDVSVDIERKWSKKFKSLVSWVHQEYNKGAIEGGANAMLVADIIIGDIRFKFNRKTALRTEIQHLWSKQEDLNWLMGLMEFSYAPNWSVHISDMYNYGDTDVHYYSVGASYSKDSSRLSLGYARNREGIECVGGICRLVPAYSGINFSVSVRF